MTERGKWGYTALKDNRHTGAVFYQHVVMYGLNQSHVCLENWSGVPHGHMNEEPVELFFVYKHAALGLELWKKGVYDRGRDEKPWKAKNWKKLEIKRGRRKWGQIEKGRFSLWQVSWWKDHFSPYLGIVFSSLPLSLPPSVPVITHSYVCPGTTGMAKKWPSQQEPSQSPAWTKTNSHRKYEAGRFIQCMMCHVMLTSVLTVKVQNPETLIIGPVCYFQSQLTHTGILSTDSNASHLNFKAAKGHFILLQPWASARNEPYYHHVTGDIRKLCTLLSYFPSLRGWWWWDNLVCLLMSSGGGGSCFPVWCSFCWIRMIGRDKT